MIVPSYWAESRRQQKAGGKTLTVSRFGWSEVSESDAQQMADRRAEEALRDIQAGKSLPKRDRKVPYNGADGLPIREEVLSRVGEEVITRNSYGAHCLNTPRALFADIDFSDDRGGSPFGFLVNIFTTLKNCFSGQSSSKAPVEKDERARQRIVDFLKTHPDWNLRLYRTPNGLRVLATHKAFQARDREVQEFFSQISADRMYVRMCNNQNCFRARLTAKPWRIGIPTHMRPRPGVWPIHPERAPLRNAWISEYEVVQKRFSSCHFVEALGSGAIDREILEVIKLHDREARALETSLPMA